MSPKNICIALFGEGGILSPLKIDHRSSLSALELRFSVRKGRDPRKRNLSFEHCPNWGEPLPKLILPFFRSENRARIPGGVNLYNT